MRKTYHQGQKVRCRGEEWQVIEAVEHKQVNGPGVWEIEALALSGIVKGETYVFLDDLDDIETIDPSDIRPVLDNSPKVQKTRTFLEAHLRRLLPRNGAIYLGEHGAFDTSYEYQLEPAALALNMLRPRILIGDAVGLGKTIECGILLSELIRRGKGRRILCAVPKAILEQFQMEMWGRFAIPFHRLDSKGLERLRQDIPSTMNPFFHHNKVIISIDTLKLKKYQTLLEDCNWDALVIDECHNVADRTDGMGGSARHRVAKRIAENSRSVILMSATPHDGTKYGFASLIKLLDRTLIPSDDNYTKDDIESVFIRRTRVSVKDQIRNQQQRIDKLQEVPLNAKETNLLQELHDIDFRAKNLKTRSSKGVKELFRTTLIKSFLSSPAALLETVDNKHKNLNKIWEKDHGNEDLQRDIQVLEDIQQSVKDLKDKFTRMDHLIKLINDQAPSKNDKIVIFTERIATMEYVAEQLIKAGVCADLYKPNAYQQPTGSLLAKAHGGESDTNLIAIVKAFQAQNSRVNVLVTTNVSSEGLNLHENCHRLVHFDLPWSLITLEQRNGRIDRLGQKEQPEIYYLASTAGSTTRQAPKDLKDDFWIVNKIKARMDQAAEDMDEEAYRGGFVSSVDEEEHNTSKYEKEAAIFNDQLEFLQSIASGANQDASSKIKRKKLPTLFKTSPADFVETMAKEAGISLQSQSQSEITVSLDNKLRHEVCENWPYEFRPTKDKLSFEINKEIMEKHYRARTNASEPLDRIFLNEINPAINLLEHTALGLFPGQNVPVIKTKAEPGSVYFLLQGTLFNNVNESVFQSWQLVEFKSGSNKCETFVDLTEPEHTLEIVKTVNECLDNFIRNNSLSNSEEKRISSLIPKALQWMTDLTLKAREKRAELKRPYLENELKRIKKWEKERKEYLTNLTSSQGKSMHGGQFAIIKKAEAEMEKLSKDTEKFKEFIQKTIVTDANPDIKILAIFLSPENNA